MIDEYLMLLESNPNQLAEIQNRLQSILDRDKDGSISERLREALLKRNQANPDNIYFSQMLLWHSIQKKDFDFAMIQAISLDKRLNEDGSGVFALCQICMSNNAYEVAAKGFEHIIDKGRGYPYYVPARTGSLRARFMILTSSPVVDNEELEKLQEQYFITINELGYIPESIQLRRDYAHIRAFYQDEMEEAINILQESISIPGANPVLVAESKIELADIYLFVGEVWEATLLYSQVEKAFKNDPVGHEATLKNARLSFYIGEFDWAKAQLDVLKAATSKFIANDALELSLLITDNLDPDSTYTGLKLYSTAEMLSYQNKDSLALATLDSIALLGLWHPLNDEVLYKKAQIYIKQHKFDKADSLLIKVNEMYPYEILGDNALFTRADLYEHVFEDKEKAMELYQQLLIDYPGSLLTTEARRRFRALRGDNTES
jgi:tetratricopeptide (TPR) repeat protein